MLGFSASRQRAEFHSTAAWVCDDSAEAVADICSDLVSPLQSTRALSSGSGPAGACLPLSASSASPRPWSPSRQRTTVTYRVLSNTHSRITKMQAAAILDYPWFASRWNVRLVVYICDIRRVEAAHVMAVLRIMRLRTRTTLSTMAMLPVVPTAPASTKPLAA